MYRPGSSLSKSKANKKNDSIGLGLPVKKIENKIPSFEDYIKDRDWVGAIAVLEH